MQPRSSGRAASGLVELRAAVREQPPEKPVADEFTATVRVDAEPGDKKFQGVWLERDDGVRWVVAYRPEPWLAAFEGQRVQVTGAVYQPEGQAILAPHFRVETLRLAPGATTDAPFVAVLAERRLAGTFQERVGGPGTKLEGERYLVFEADDGTAYLLANAPAGGDSGRAATVKARVIEMSPYVARRGGPYLWVLDVEPGRASPSRDGRP
ncbi:hypothetical protein OV079_30250 [Nannocystis pusilla]|uniref:Uncharacterized protein n=1 Tax=Nannocystis pusilla TaxID=889268 RepID=A0A9X3EUA3_9BACT|nr:hypothetical protein [Nannocystis pusilla]MCY1009770.1 hypothetical protein [Nannocystis pusilla]